MRFNRNNHGKNKTDKLLFNLKAQLSALINRSADINNKIEKITKEIERLETPEPDSTAPVVEPFDAKFED